MKVSFTTGLVFLLSGLPVLGQAWVQDFDEGVRLYEEGLYEEALDAYRQVEQAGVESTALFHNMGNAHYRLNQLGWAILYYERARRLDPSDPELLHNLGVARSRTQDQISQIPRPIWVRVWDQGTALIGPRALYAIGFMFYLIALALIAHRIWHGQRSDWIRRGILLSLIAGLLFLGAAFLASIDDASTHEAVVIQTRVEVYEAPSITAPTATQVHEGLLVSVVGQQPNWMHIRLPNGTSGWIDATALVEV